MPSFCITARVPNNGKQHCIGRAGVRGAGAGTSTFAMQFLELLGFGGSAFSWVFVFVRVSVVPERERLFALGQAQNWGFFGCWGVEFLLDRFV